VAVGFEVGLFNFYDCLLTCTALFLISDVYDFLPRALSPPPLSTILHPSSLISLSSLALSHPLFTVARTEDHLEGDVIIHKGDMGSTFYVILEGVVLITEASLGDGDDVGASGDSMSPGKRRCCCCARAGVFRLAQTAFGGTYCAIL